MREILISLGNHLMMVSFIYVGDSVHLVRPTSKGTALTFEDETGLETVISKFGLCDKAFKEYKMRGTKLSRQF